MHNMARSISADSADAKSRKTDATADLAARLAPCVVRSSTALVLVFASRTVGLRSVELQTRTIYSSRVCRKSVMSWILSRGLSHKQPRIAFRSACTLLEHCQRWRPIPYFNRQSQNT